MPTTITISDNTARELRIALDPLRNERHRALNTAEKAILDTISRENLKTLEPRVMVTEGSSGRIYSTVYNPAALRAAVAPWIHNPENVPWENVPAGWRFLTLEEVRALVAFTAPEYLSSPAKEFRYTKKNLGTPPKEFCDDCDIICFGIPLTYITTLPAGAVAPWIAEQQKPKCNDMRDEDKCTKERGHNGWHSNGVYEWPARRPLSPNDFPFGSLLRDGKGKKYVVIGNCMPDVVIVINDERAAESLGIHDLATNGFEYLAPRTTEWQNCYK